MAVKRTAIAAMSSTLGPRTLLTLRSTPLSQLPFGRLTGPSRNFIGTRSLAETGSLILIIFKADLLLTASVTLLLLRALRVAARAGRGFRDVASGCPEGIGLFELELAIEGGFLWRVCSRCVEWLLGLDTGDNGDGWLTLRGDRLLLGIVIATLVVGST